MSSQVQLSEGERKVLRGLLEADNRMTAASLAASLREREHGIISILNLLADKSLIRLEVKESHVLRLTPEGEDYARGGLPEARLLDAVSRLGGTADIDAATTQAGLKDSERGIAISWARKNGWLTITKEQGHTTVRVVTDQIRSDLADVLTLVLRGAGEVPPQLSQAVEQALSRKLLERVTVKRFEAWIPDEMRPVAQTLIKLEDETIGDLTPEMIVSGGYRGRRFRPYNVDIEPPVVHMGRKHPYAEFNDWLREVLVGLGFTEWFGPYVETEFWNNDALFVPQDHVAREVQDQFKVASPYDHGDIIDEKHYRAVKAAHENGFETGSTGWQSAFSRDVATRLCLRAHTTAVSVRYLWEHRDPPQKMFIVDRNFRAESLDARHAQEFDQCEGIILDRGLTLRDLMGYLSEICRRVGVRKVKFKPGQFPFTEPSVETYAKHDVLGWIEVAPGGIFRPEVTYPLGIHDPVLAWGIGSGRLYMAAMGINDIRDLFSRDLNWIRRQYFVR
ncbi:MAG: phenylalanine--tRNA ligase subunit alpha [Candidatus Thorarchaeota archaeon]